MLLKVFVVLALAAVALAQTPARPNPSLVFEAQARLEIETKTDKFFGEGHWRVDQPKGLGEEFFEFGGNHHLDIFMLERYDLGHTYEIESTNKTDCVVKDVKGKMPNPWTWLQTATFFGKRKFRGHEYDIWVNKVGTDDVGMAVEEGTPNRPVFIETNSTTTKTVARILFDMWQTHETHTSWFDVPKECK